MKPYQVQAWARHQRRQPLHEFHRCEHDVGGGVAPRGLELEHDVAFAVDAQGLVGDGRAGDVTGELFDALAVVRLAAIASS